MHQDARMSMDLQSSEPQGFSSSSLAGDYAVIVNAENADGFADPVQTVITVAGEEEKPVTKPKLAGDVNGDNSVNIFDLVMVAGQFGKSGAGLSGDVNGDSIISLTWLW